MFHIILFEPQIPPNTGNIIRLCANTGCTLHLIEPLGFTLDEKSLRRAGLDYRDLAEVRVHSNLDTCLLELNDCRVFGIETGCVHKHTDVRFQPGDALLFGSETRGLPPKVLERVAPGHRLSIPMLTSERSLNLSNAVAVTVYEAWRQHGFQA